MCIISKQFEIVQSKFPFANQENVPFYLFIYCNLEILLLRYISVAVRSGFGTILQLMESADFNQWNVYH
jgi:hypothetical protein